MTTAFPASSRPSHTPAAADVEGRLTTSYPTERLTKINAKKATITRLEVESRDEQWELLAS